MTRTILLVEDNADHEALALRALKQSNIAGQVLVARDGDEALSVLLNAEQHLPVGLVLLDLQLQKVSGLEVLRRMRSHPATAWLPVVVLTSSDEDGDIRQSYALGANSYVLKPVDYDQFVHVARQLVDYWFALNQLPSGR